jgi:hypothetical protein
MHYFKESVMYSPISKAYHILIKTATHQLRRIAVRNCKLQGYLSAYVRTAQVHRAALNVNTCRHHGDAKYLYITKDYIDRNR